jgi:hypothetical protein
MLIFLTLLFVVVLLDATTQRKELDPLCGISIAHFHPVIPANNSGSWQQQQQQQQQVSVRPSVSE